MIWILVFISAVIIYSWWTGRDPARQTMTKEQRLAHDISQLSPEWQETIRVYREKKNASHTDC